MKELIKLLTESYGPSGREENIRDIISKEIEGHFDEIKTDYLCNLIALKKGGAPNAKNVMIAAHMDEIGLMITHIDDKGFLRFTNVGGVNPYRLIGMRIILPSGRKGVVFHESLEKMADLAYDKMYIDIGAADKDECQDLVQIGDIAVADQETVLSGNRVIAKALDDRIGCAVMIDAMKKMKNSPNNVYFVFTTQEELGLRGAKTSTYGIAPDFGLALDVTLTGDTPEAKRMDVKLGGGTAIKVKDSSLITNPKVVQFLIDIAEKENIKYQLEVLEGGGTDAGAINLTKGGILAGCLSIPCRYVHSPSELVDMGDVEATRDLLIKLLESKLTFL